MNTEKLKSASTSSSPCRLVLRAHHYATGERMDIACEHGLITSLTPAEDHPVDLEADWLAPALFDLQINGCDGISFNSPRLTADDIRHVVGVCRRHGIGALCPTLITNAHESLTHGFTMLRRACDADADLSRALPAFHLEGPYISPNDGPRGAHPLGHVRPPDWDEFRHFQDAAGGRIRLVTLAPEREGAVPFIEKLVASGVVVALGHTAATPADIRTAIAAGARLSTHLGNGSHAQMPRHDNYLWEQLAADELWASVISDGHHLPPAVLRCILRVKTPARTILTCDASSLAGLPPGRYREWDQEFEVLPTGRIVVPGTTFLAGSGVFTDACIGHLLALGDTSLADAVDMAGARPRQLLGLETRPLEVGAPADLVLFDWQAGFDSPLPCTRGRGVGGEGVASPP
ncbi:MAG TPA: amidohydrolase family protein, partial [Gemmataceae bacterium]|nr:amidohydrolase family protein [Gemmataceae bacterium]